MERGSKLINIVPKSSKCIFQLPRGNLEAIHPRILSIHLIGDLLDASKYWCAFDLLRKQRINVNLIVDHNPKKFLDELDLFVEQIKNPQWLNLFITDLQNQDITHTMYASNYDRVEQQSKYPDLYDIEKKVHNVCDKMIDVFERHADMDYDLPKITCYVKKGLVEHALSYIWRIKKSETQQQSRSKAEEALRYLLYLVDVNQLYNVALGMYDFGLVLFVATKSQKDPKEYLPLCESYRTHQ
jgi:elongator complex protein 1